MNREWMVLSERIELSTSHLPSECSTTELRQHSCATVFALTNGVCVSKLNPFELIKHLKKLNDLKLFKRRTLTGVMSHVNDTLNWTIVTIYRTDRESISSKGVWRTAND